jgi:tetratricopeptide (TPR) repeat protein
MSFYVSRDVGRIFYEARQYDEALVALQEAAEMNANSPVVYNWLSWNYDKKGLISQSIEMDLKDEAVNATSEEKLFRLRKAYENSGQRGYLRKKLEMTGEGPYLSGQINARLGNRDEAFR